VKGALRHCEDLVDALPVDIDDLKALQTLQERFASLGQPPHPVERKPAIV
jgi:hypothetical protein